MEVLKLYVVLLSVFVVALACDLKETTDEITAKTAVETYINNTRPKIVSRYRQHYHVASPVGWMNDPNGFSFFKENYHLFYQFYPYNTSTGNIHWGHVISKDLVTWTQLPIALVPENEQCFSGSAIEIDGMLVLMYTADQKINGSPNESQYLAFSTDGIIFNKYKKKNPVISFSPNNSPDFRDPKVWKRGNYYYVVLGSKTDNNLGRVLLYKSLDMGYWEYVSVIGASNGSLGYMWECPDFFELNGSYILLMSPQGMSADGDRYHNQFQTGYIIGNFDYTTGKFTETVSFQEIDYGHDFYATQTMENNGKRYLVAWMGSWDGEFPERADGWAGSMTIIRELTLHGNRVLMKPIDAMATLRSSLVIDGSLASAATIDTLNQTAELIVSFNMSQHLSLSIAGASDEKLVTVGWNATSRKISLDRNDATGIRQGVWTPVSSQSLRIFLDASSIEMFCGEGEVVFSSRVYPNGMWRVTNSGAQTIHIVAYSLDRSVPE